MSKRITSLDVLGEIRRAMRILRRTERYLEQEERAAKRHGEKTQRQHAERHSAAAGTRNDYTEQG